MNMNALLRPFVYGLAAALSTLDASAAQEAPPPQQKQPPANPAVVKEIRWLNAAQQDGGVTFDHSLSVILHQNLVSSSDLGVDIAELQPALRAQLELAEGTGLVLTAVPEDCPGGRAGLKAHDVLIKVGQATVGNAEQLTEALAKAEGKPVRVELLRQGKPLTLEVTPQKPQVAEIVFADADVPVSAWSQITVKQEPRYRIGVVLNETDDTLRAQIGLAAGEGLIVTEVFPDSPAAKAGIQQHDVLTILDGKRLTTVDAINAQIQELQEREAALKLLRGGKEVTLRILPRRENFAVNYADMAHQPLTIWNAGGCPVQVQSSSCTTCHQTPNLTGWNQGGAHKHYWTLSQWFARQPAQEGSPQAQVNQLKEQLAKMQETLQTLEAALQTDAANEEKQPEQHEKK